MPRAPGGCQRGRVFVKISCGKSVEDLSLSLDRAERTGPMSASVVSSRTFSMADLEGSKSGVRIRVAPGMTLSLS